MSDPLAPASYPRRKIFVLSSLALFTAGTSFALRGAIIADVVAELAPGSATLAGSLLGTAFLVAWMLSPRYGLVAVFRQRKASG